MGPTGSEAILNPITEAAIFLTDLSTAITGNLFFVRSVDFLGIGDLSA